MTNSAEQVDCDEFASIHEDSILLSEHEAVMANVALAAWMSAALSDPAVCDAMKADINRWFSAGFLYLNKVREIIKRREIEAGEKVKEAAARENLMICLANCEGLTDEAMEILNFAADRIRALNVEEIVK